METVINSDSDHAEMLAQYIDTALRCRLGKLSEKEIEDAVRSCLEMLRYLAVRPPSGWYCPKGAVYLRQPQHGSTCRGCCGCGCVCVSVWVSTLHALCSSRRPHLCIVVCAGQGPVLRALLPAAVPPPAAKEVGVRRAGEVW